MKTSNTDKLRATAYHEAGHVVAMLRLSIRVISVTIVADPTKHQLGCVRLASRRGLARRLNSGRRTLGDVEFIERECVATLAGPIAEAKFKGRRCNVGAADDYSNVVDGLSKLASSDREVEAWAKLLVVRAEDLVETFWQDVQRLADELARVKTIRGESVLRSIIG